MEQTTILLAVRPRMFSESLHEAMRQRLRSSVQVVALERWFDFVDIAAAIRSKDASVVIMTVALDKRVPGHVAVLLDEFPDLLVLALDLRAERARTYRKRLEIRTLRDFSVSGLLDALRAAVPNGFADGF